MGYHYFEATNGVWTVGTGTPWTEAWCAESDHRSPEAAAARVHYLNGGSGGSLRAGLAEADRAFEELAAAVRRLLEDLAPRWPYGMPAPARDLAELIGWHPETTIGTDEAGAAGKER